MSEYLQECRLELMRELDAERAAHAAAEARVTQLESLLRQVAQRRGGTNARLFRDINAALSGATEPKP